MVDIFGFPDDVFAEPFGGSAPDGLTPAQIYEQRILAVDPVPWIGLWPLSETEGTTAFDVSGNEHHGTYNSVTLNAGEFLDGSPAPAFAGGTGSFVQLPHGTLDTPFNPALGSWMGWMQVSALADWTDGLNHIAGVVGNNSSNRVVFFKTTVNNQFIMRYQAGGTAEDNTLSLSSTDWIQMIVTWDVAEDEAIFYLDGAVSGITEASLGTWVGALTANFCQIGASSGGNGWKGGLKYWGLRNTVLTPEQVASLFF